MHLQKVTLSPSLDDFSKTRGSRDLFKAEKCTELIILSMARITKTKAYGKTPHFDLKAIKMFFNVRYVELQWRNFMFDVPANDAFALILLRL